MGLVGIELMSMMGGAMSMMGGAMSMMGGAKTNLSFGASYVDGVQAIDVSYLGL